VWVALLWETLARDMVLGIIPKGGHSHKGTIQLRSLVGLLLCKVNPHIWTGCFLILCKSGKKPEYIHSLFTVYSYWIVTLTICEFGQARSGGGLSVRCADLWYLPYQELRAYNPHIANYTVYTLYNHLNASYTVYRLLKT